LLQIFAFVFLHLLLAATYFHVVFSQSVSWHSQHYNLYIISPSLFKSTNIPTQPSACYFAAWSLCPACIRRLGLSSAHDRFFYVSVYSWRKQIRDDWWPRSVWVDECLFWYQLTRVVPDKIQRVIKRLSVCSDYTHVG